ncbi:hypothetical protein [Phormidium sp. CCY1219]|uniref:hypothetical protein n=1 Tax=Phormidium sp. CCY1219 TaxID=2886104 RepID=UPI002D768415|nr:hypothetical protein [Phormidium sp. CCY1219]
MILECNQVRLGDRVLLGPKVQIYTATHPLDPAQGKEGCEFVFYHWRWECGDARCAPGGCCGGKPLSPHPQARG